MGTMYVSGYFYNVDACMAETLLDDLEGLGFTIRNVESDGVGDCEEDEEAD